MFANSESILFMVASSLAVYALVFVVHALRRSISQAPLFAVLGFLAAMTVWITDTMVRVQVGPFTFLYGSVVFFLALLLAVFLSYVFDGTHSGQMAIMAAVGITLLTPIAALMTGYQTTLPGTVNSYPIAQPSLPIHGVSAFAMLADFVGMAIVWQWLANRPRPWPLVLRVFLSLLAALWLDVLIFTTVVFHSDDAFFGILRANILSRLVLAALVAPLTAAYVAYEVRRYGLQFARRPLLAILSSSSRTEQELSLAQQEVERRRTAERALEDQLHFRESLLAAIPYPVFYKDATGRYLGGNRAFDQQMRASRTTYVGRTAAELFAPEQASTFESEDERLLREPGVHTFETTTTLPDGGEAEVIVCKSTFLDYTGAIAGIVGVTIDITERKRLERQLEDLAMKDPLTGALNRRSFIQSVQEEILRAERYKSTFSIIMLDADRFKRINDTFGHAAGDEALRRIVAVCREVCRESDLISRLGGEEFAVLALNAGLDDALALAERIRTRLEQEEFACEKGTYHVTASIGVAQRDAATRNADEILHRADESMYEAKSAGGNRVYSGRSDK